MVLSLYMTVHSNTAYCCNIVIWGEYIVSVLFLIVVSDYEGAHAQYPLHLCCLHFSGNLTGTRHAWCKDEAAGRQIKISHVAHLSSVFFFYDKCEGIPYAKPLGSVAHSISTSLYWMVGESATDYKEYADCHPTKKWLAWNHLDRMTWGTLWKIS